MKHSCTVTNLQIKRSDSIEDFETYLRTPSTFKSNLIIPNDLDEGGGIGTSVALCQFLLTWARHSDGNDIKTYLHSGDEQAAERFTSRVHGLCAAYFSTKLLGAESGDIRTSVMRSARPRVEAMSRGDVAETSKGQSIEFIFVQGAENEFHGSVYSRAPTLADLRDRQKHSECIRGNRELDRFLEKCFNQLNILNLLKKKSSNADFIYGELLSELFKNTAEHGYLKIGGERYKQNLRCIRLAVSDIKRESLVEKSVSSAGAKIVAQEYFRSMAEQRTYRRPRDHIKFLELSIFDSGPGFAATIEARDVPDAEEARQAVAKCFYKRRSAKSAPNAGMGLPKVINLLNHLNGFIRIRTSSVEAFYGADPGYPAVPDPDTFVHGNLTPVEGSVVTICIPLAY